MASENVRSEEQPVERIGSVERIQDLIEIDKDVTRILQAAAGGIGALTSSQSTSSSDPELASGAAAGTAGRPRAVQEQKASFEAHTRELYSLIQAVSARLRRQTYALEEAGIITADTTSLESDIPPPPAPLQQVPTRQTTGGPAGAQAKPDPPMPVINGGLGNLDVGWLNSRRDEVGKRKEQELWAEARDRLQQSLKASNRAEDDGDQMDVDQTT